MPSENVQVVMNIFDGRLAPGGGANLLELFTDQAVVERVDDFYEESAPTCVGRMSGSGLEVDTPVAAVYDLEGGRVVRQRHFLDQDQARAEAGLT